MLFLPILLGVWLDAATATLFDYTEEDRVHFAFANFTGIVLLYWCVGISFMLVITVSVLQVSE